MKNSPVIVVGLIFLLFVSFVRDSFFTGGGNHRTIGKGDNLTVMCDDYYTFQNRPAHARLEFSGAWRCGRYSAALPEHSNVKSCGFSANVCSEYSEIKNPSCSEVWQSQSASKKYNQMQLEVLLLLDPESSCPYCHKSNVALQRRNDEKWETMTLNIHNFSNSFLDDVILNLHVLSKRQPSSVVVYLALICWKRSETCVSPSQISCKSFVTNKTSCTVSQFCSRERRTEINQDKQINIFGKRIIWQTKLCCYSSFHEWKLHGVCAQTRALSVGHDRKQWKTKTKRSPNIWNGHLLNVIIVIISVLRVMMKVTRHRQSAKDLSLRNHISGFFHRDETEQDEETYLNNCRSDSNILKMFMTLPCVKLADTGRLSTLARHYTVTVRPLTRFLPDTTNNPALDLAHVGYRLATLSALHPSVPVSRVKLADAGFYFRGKGDEMMCYKCQARHSGWRGEDNPMEVHRHISPHCAHVLERDRQQAEMNETNTPDSASLNDPQRESSTGNSSSSANDSLRAMNSVDGIPVEDGDVPHSGATIAAEVSSTAPLAPITAAAAGSGSSRTSASAVSAPHVLFTSQEPSLPLPTVSPARSQGGVAVPDGSSSTAGGAGSSGSCGGSITSQMFPRAGLDLGGAVYPMYQDMASRRRSFPRWDETRAPPLDQLIPCGMFYAGYADCVRCFYCGVGLKHWEVSDDVWEEHVRWRPSCGYLRAVKGDHFIRQVQVRLGREAGGGHDDEDGGERRADREGHGDNVRSASSPIARAIPRQQQAPDPAATELRPETRAAPTTAHSTSDAVSAAVRASSSSADTADSPSRTSQPPVIITATAQQSARGRTTTPTSTPAASATPVSPPESRNSQSGARPDVASIVSGAQSDAEESSSERVRRLQAENQELSRRLRCKLCHRDLIEVILMPCGHLVLCEACSSHVTHCPLCHERVRATARVHMM